MDCTNCSPLVYKNANLPEPGKTAPKSQHLILNTNQSLKPRAGTRAVSVVSLTSACGTYEETINRCTLVSQWPIKSPIGFCCNSLCLQNETAKKLLFMEENMFSASVAKQFSFINNFVLSEQKKNLFSWSCCLKKSVQCSDAAGLSWKVMESMFINIGMLKGNKIILGSIWLDCSALCTCISPSASARSLGGKTPPCSLPGGERLPEEARDVNCDFRIVISIKLRSTCVIKRRAPHRALLLEAFAGWTHIPVFLCVTIFRNSWGCLTQPHRQTELLLSPEPTPVGLGLCFGFFFHNLHFKRQLWRMTKCCLLDVRKRPSKTGLHLPLWNCPSDLDTKVCSF